MQEALSLRKKIVKTNNKAAGVSAPEGCDRCSLLQQQHHDNVPPLDTDRASMAAYEDAVEGGHTLDLSTPLPAAMPGAQQHEQLDHHQHHQQQLGQLGNTLQDTEQMQQGSMVQQQEDFLTASLKQQFMTDISSFFQAEVVPRSMAISEVCCSNR